MMQIEDSNIAIPRWLLQLKAIVSIALAVIAGAFVLFHFLDAVRGLGSFELLSGHLMFSFVITFLMLPLVRNHKSVSATLIDLSVSIIFVGFSIIVMLYTLHYHLYEARWRPGIVTGSDIWVGIIMVFLVLEATRRRHGMILPLIASIFILYAFVGSYLPGFIGHRGFDYERVFTFIGPNTTEGILGVPLSASATYVAMFLFFAAFLYGSGAGELFSDIAFRVAGQYRGGPAKAAVIASCFFGMISGSAVANVVSTGMVTIPLMKRTGYKPHFAGAVEAVASTGGQFMPPIMGAGAFIMAEILGIPYSKVIIVAFFPAILYFVALFWAIDFEAVITGLKGLAKAELPPAKKIIGNIYMFGPMLILIYMLVVLMWSPGKAAFWSIVCLWVLSMLKVSTRMGPKKLMIAVKEGANAAADVGTICACAGIIIGVMSMTGLGLRLSSGLIYLSHGSLPFLALLTMIVAMILGMGITTSAVYIILATLVAPAMVSLGVNPIAAHLFCFYFGCISCITPPVAIAAYAAAGIAKSEPMKTGWTATRLGIAGYIVPFIFIYNNNLLMLGRPAEIILAIITSLIGVFFLAAASEGYLLRNASLWQRVLLMAASIFLIVPGFVTDVVGIALGGLVVITQWITNRKEKRQIYYQATQISR